MKKTMFICFAMLISLAMIFNSCKKDTEDDTPAPIPKPTFTDPRDGQVYMIVEIGDQTWMAENLRAIKYSNGTPIPKVEGTAEWDALNRGEKAYCWPDNDSISNGMLYGALYTWDAAMNEDSSNSVNPSGVQGICPDGWHLPNDSEWKQLEMYLGMSQTAANDIGFRGTVGGKMKEAGTAHWNPPNSGATNESGFTALPAGNRSPFGNFVPLGLYAYFWSASKGENSVWVRALNNNNEGVYRFCGSFVSGISVRCIKN